MVESGFTRKKVASLTLGEKLKKIRDEYRISLNEIARQTKIQARYLEYLEKGEYEKLPAEVYVRGFLRSLAQYLGVDEKAFIKLYDRERHIQDHLRKETQAVPTENKTFHFPSFIITPKLIVTAGVFLLVLVGFFYLYREFQAFVSEPRLIILEPENGQRIERGEVVVRGQTDKDAELFINNQPTIVKDDGGFLETIRLQPGLNTLSLVAANKFHKEKSVTIAVQAEYQAVAAPSEEESGQAVVPAISNRLEITALNKTAHVRVEADGAVIFDGPILPGTPQTFESVGDFRVSTDRAGDTLARFNDEKARSLGEKAVPIKDIVFSKENAREL